MFPQRGPWVLHEAQSCPASRSSSYASRRMEAGERRNRKEQGQTEDLKSYFCSDYHSGPWAKNQLLFPSRWNQHSIQPGFDVHHPAVISRDTSGVSGEASTWKDAQWSPISLDFWVTLDLEKHLETWHAGQ